MKGGVAGLELRQSGRVLLQRSGHEAAPAWRLVGVAGLGLPRSQVSIWSFFFFKKKMYIFLNFFF